MGDYVIRRLTNQDPDFYLILGPFLGSRQVANALGNPVWDDPGKVWYVAMQDGTVCGFVAALPQSGGILFCSDYVTPDHREHGAYTALFTARLAEWAEEPVLTATVAPSAVDTYERNGFRPAGNRGRYTTMRRERVGHSASGKRTGSGDR